MKNLLSSFLALVFLSFGIFLVQPDSRAHAEESGHKHEESEDSVDSHDHAHEEEVSEKSHNDGGDEHKEEHGHGHGDEDKESEENGHEEENSAIGPGKGITEKTENGFKLSEKAIQNFNIKTSPISSKTLEVDRTSLVEIKDQKFIYRIRDGWIKKVSVRVVSKTKLKLVLELSEFNPTDLIITSGNGFVRTAEIITEEGMAGHSH